MEIVFGGSIDRKHFAAVRTVNARNKSISTIVKSQTIAELIGNLGGFFEIGTQDSLPLKSEFL